MRFASKNIFFSRISPHHRLAYLPLIAVAILLIAWLDHITGDLPVQHLYYLPIIFGGIAFGMNGGLIVAFTSVVLYHLANAQLLDLRHSKGDIVQIVLFFTVGIIASKLTDDAKRMRVLAGTDDLTGLHNLRSFKAHLTTLVIEAKTKNIPLSLLALDVDRLKTLNDTFGHLTGADAVRTVGHVIGRHIPPTAVACRYGGDEFVIALPECTIEQAVEIGECLRWAVHDVQPTLASCWFPAGTLSISVGVATLERELDHKGEDLFGAADRALYRAKGEGRNRVCAFSH